MNLRSSSQAMLDYIVVLIIAVIVVMFVYPHLVKSLSGKMREAGDTFGGGEVYEPGKSVITVNKTHNTK